MWNLFILKNFGFAVNLLASLAFFAGAWLHFDSMTNRKSIPTTLRWIGFLLLSLAFLIAPLNTGSPELIIRFVGYLTLIISLITDPLISKPANIFFAGSFTITYFFPPIAALLCALLFLRKATVGLEKHLTPLAVTFFLLTIAETLSAFTHFRNSPNPTIFAFLAQYGPIWIATQGVFLITILYFQRWVFRYLLKRFQSQIFFILTSSVVIIFLATTFIFTAVLTQNIERESLSRLESNSQTLNLALNYQKTSIQSLAILLSQQSDLIAALSKSDSTQLSPILNPTFFEQKIDSLIIASTSGRILFQAEDANKAGGSLSSLPLFQKAVSGQTTTSIVNIESPLVPQLAIISSVPIVNPAKQILGVLMISQILDQTLIDELHKNTLLDIVLYSDNHVSGVSFTKETSTRLTGTTITDNAIISRVLKQGQTFSGETKIANQLFLGSYLPLTDSDKVAVGMLFVGTPAKSTLDTINSSLQTAFISSILLLALSIIPSYFISRYLTKQIH